MRNANKDNLEKAVKSRNKSAEESKDEECPNNKKGKAVKWSSKLREDSEITEDESEHAFSKTKDITKNSRQKKVSNEEEIDKSEKPWLRLTFKRTHDSRKDMVQSEEDEEDEEEIKKKETKSKNKVTKGSSVLKAVDSNCMLLEEICEKKSKSKEKVQDSEDIEDFDFDHYSSPIRKKPKTSSRDTDQEQTLNTPKNKHEGLKSNKISDSGKKLYLL